MEMGDFKGLLFIFVSNCYQKVQFKFNKLVLTRRETQLSHCLAGIIF
jgi:hypothetical protein